MAAGRDAGRETGNGCRQGRRQTDREWLQAGTQADRQGMAAGRDAGSRQRCRQRDREWLQAGTQAAGREWLQAGMQAERQGMAAGREWLQAGNGCRRGTAAGGERQGTAAGRDRQGTAAGRERLQAGNGCRQGTAAGRERLQAGNGCRQGTAADREWLQAHSLRCSTSLMRPRLSLVCIRMGLCSRPGAAPGALHSQPGQGLHQGHYTVSQARALHSWPGQGYVLYHAPGADQGCATLGTLQSARGCIRAYMASQGHYTNSQGPCSVHGRHTIARHMIRAATTTPGATAQIIRTVRARDAHKRKDQRKNTL